jgi:hypothetical protein
MILVSTNYSYLRVGRHIALISEGERSMRGDSWFPHGGVQRRPTARVGRHLDWPEVEDNQSNQLSESLFGSDNVAEIKQAAKIKWAGKERFLGRKKIGKKKLDWCNLNKKTNIWIKNIGD